MAEKKAGHWKFREANLTTGKPYFDWVPAGKAGQPPQEPAPEIQAGTESLPGTPLTPRERGNYTADIDSAALEKRDEQKEARVREAKGLPPEE